MSFVGWQHGMPQKLTMLPMMSESNGDFLITTFVECVIAFVSQ